MKSKVTMERDLELTTNSPDDQRLKKRWAYLSALPSEYLIHFRKGKLQEKAVGREPPALRKLEIRYSLFPPALRKSFLKRIN